MTYNHDPLSAVSTPWDAPLVPEFPFQMRDVTILTTFYRTSIDAVSSILPPPLEPASDIVAVHLYQMNDTDFFGRYQESAVQVDVHLPGTEVRGAYSPYLFLDSDGAIAAGREVYGQPKKYGSPSIRVKKDLVVGTVKRNGVRFLRVTTPYKQRRADIAEARELFDFVTNINYKVIPASAGGVAIRELTARELEAVTVHECWRAPGTVEISPHAQAPVHRLPVVEMLDAFYWSCDFTLGPARVVHTYEPQSMGSAILTAANLDASLDPCGEV